MVIRGAQQRRSGTGTGRWPTSGAIVLAVGLGSLSAVILPASAADAPDAATAAVAVPLPGTPQPPAPPFTGNPELKARLDSPGTLVVAGERMHAELLRRFYGAHDYQTVWDSHPAAAAALTKAVLAAETQGLDPALFHGPAIAEQAAKLAPLDRELLLSDAFLSYADALSRGAMPIEERYDDEDLSPEPVDLVAVIDAAMNAADPAQVVTALAPNTPEYQAMLRTYAEAKEAAQSEPTAPHGRAAPNRGAAEKQLRQLAVNLERLRWLPRSMPPDRVMVNTATQTLELFRDDRPVFTTRVVVGQPDWQTPEFQSTIDSVLYNPPWNVPPSILRKEILPKIAANPDYLTAHHMRYRGPNRVQQEAGPHSALGRLKFEMPDRFDVYLHDTPEKHLFYRGVRMLSHGCVRVQNPPALAALLLDTGPQEIAKGIAVGTTHRRSLATPMPVFIVYQTALVEANGSIRFMPDAYERDAEIWEHLDQARHLPLAQQGAGGQRKG